MTFLSDATSTMDPTSSWGLGRALMLGVWLCSDILFPRGLLLDLVLGMELMREMVFLVVSEGEEGGGAKDC